MASSNQPVSSKRAASRLAKALSRFGISEKRFKRVSGWPARRKAQRRRAGPQARSQARGRRKRHPQPQRSAGRSGGAKRQSGARLSVEATGPKTCPELLRPGTGRAKGTASGGPSGPARRERKRPEPTAGAAAEERPDLARRARARRGRGRMRDEGSRRGGAGPRRLTQGRARLVNRERSGRGTGRDRRVIQEPASTRHSWRVGRAPAG